MISNIHFHYPKRAIIFDWDGTLFDSMTYKRQNFVQIFKQFTSEKSAILHLHSRYSGIPRIDLFKTVYKELLNQELSEKLFQDLSREYTNLNTQYCGSANLFPEVLAILTDLAREYDLVVSSSSEQLELDAAIGAKNISHLFKIILGSSPRFSKGPAHVADICTRLDVSKSEILFVGDDHHDEVLAIRSEIDALRIIRDKEARNSTSPTLMPRITHLAEIYSYLSD